MARATVPSPTVAALGTDFDSVTVNPSLAFALRPAAVTQWMLPYLAAMTPQYVEMLLRQMLYGSHVACMELFTIMIDTSPEMQACVEEYTNGILKKKMLFEAYHEEDEEPSDLATEKCKIVSSALRNMRPDATRDENGLSQTIKDLAFARFHGVSILANEWVDTYGTGDRFIREIPNVGDVQCLRSTYWVHPICYAWDVSGRVGLNIPQNKLKDAVNKAKADKIVGTSFWDNNLAFGQSVQNKSFVTPFPANDFIIAIAKAKTGGVFGASVLRPLAMYWVMCNFNLDFAMKYAELFGIPQRKVSYDANTPDKIKAEIRQFLQSAGSAPWTMMPKGVEVEIDKAGGGAGDSPQAFLVHLCNEMIRKVILHQTMSGGSKSQGTGVGKGGMDTESHGPKEDCIDAGARGVEEIFNLQIIPSILYLNYGEDGDLEAPIFRLIDDETGNLEDAQIVTALAQVIDLDANAVRKKFGYTTPDGKATLAGIDEGVLGEAAKVAQQQHQDQMGMQQDQMDQQQSQTDQQSAAQEDQQDATEDKQQAVEGKRAKLEASAATALAETVAPLITRLKAIAAVTDLTARRQAFEKFLKDEPGITKALKADPSLAKAVSVEAATKFVLGLKGIKA